MPSSSTFQNRNQGWAAELCPRRELSAGIADDCGIWLVKDNTDKTIVWCRKIISQIVLNTIWCKVIHFR